MCAREACEATARWTRASCNGNSNHQLNASFGGVGGATSSTSSSTVNSVSTTGGGGTGFNSSKQRTREDILEDFLSCRELPLSERRSRSANAASEVEREPVTRTLNLPQNFLK